jgi:hypothetical protein
MVISTIWACFFVNTFEKSTVDVRRIGRWLSRIALNVDLGKESSLGWDCSMTLGDLVSSMLLK